MEPITRLWKNFKVQPEIWFFYGFLLTATLTIRKVIFFFPLRGEFNEYSGVYLYLSDIFLILTLIAWIVTILYNKIGILSILKNVQRQKQNNCSTWNNYLLRGKREAMVYFVLPLVLVIWSFISLIWAENKIVDIFRSVKMLEFYLLYIFIVIRLCYWNINKIVPSQKECSNPEGMFHVEHPTEQAWNIPWDRRETITRKVFGLIMIIGLLQAIIGIIQFILQHSIGLFWLRESLISPNIDGVAKVIFNGEAFIRAYGLFPHPNILGGFLVFSIFISWAYYKMFHSAIIVPPQQECSIPEGMFHVEHPTGRAWNNFLLRGKRGTILFKLILGVQLLALILTFSKSAMLGLILGLAYVAYVSRLPSSKEMFHPARIVPRGTINGAGVKHFLCYWGGTIIDFFRKRRRLIIIVSLIIIFSFIVAKPDLHSFLFKGLNERSVYVNVSPARISMQSIASGRGTIEDVKTFVFGIGNSQFVISMKNLSVIRENWMLEPVHNIFLLIWSELGIVGFLLFVGFSLYVVKNVLPQQECSTWNILRGRRGTSSELAKTFGSIFIGLLFIMFFDHYLWDIQQGSFLLWMTMGFLVGVGEYNRTI